MKMETQKEHSKLIGLLVSVLVLAGWIWGLNWLFTRYASENYIMWYIKNGTVISILTSFFALVWEGLEEQRGLLSWHPAMFLASCMTLAGVFYSALAENLAGPLDGVNRRADDWLSIIEVLWDMALSLVMLLLMAVAVLAWLVAIAPLFYLLTFFTGAPARREIRGTGRRLLVKKDGFTTSILEQSSTAPIPENAVDVSLGRRPFALTNALNAAVLLVLKLLLQ
jgi:hypothetical protein